MSTYDNNRYLERRRRGVCVQCGIIKTKKVRCLKCRKKRWEKFKLEAEQRAKEASENWARKLCSKELRIKRMISLSGYLDRLKKRLEAA